MRALACCCVLGPLGACTGSGDLEGRGSPSPGEPVGDLGAGPATGEPSDAVAVADARPVESLLTSVQELRVIRELARLGLRPHADTVEQLLHVADRGWPYGRVGTRFGTRVFGDDVYDKACERTENPTDKALLPELGGPLYALVLAYVLTDREAYAREARSVLLDLSRSSGFTEVGGEASYTGANQCALELSWVTPLVIDSALLLASYPGWTDADERALRSWLVEDVFPVTSAIARTRKNNWGTAAAFASWSIAHYLLGTSERLEEVYPVARTLSPEEARESFLRSQLEIIGNDWRGDSRCERFGIQPHGGFPDELRRGSSGCDSDHLVDADSAYSYQMMTTSHLIYHAEALRRHGDNELFAARMADGTPMLLKAIAFVIDNDRGRSHPWKPTKVGVLRVANRFYKDPRLCAEVARSSRLAEGRYLPFARLTHALDCSDVPGR